MLDQKIKYCIEKNLIDFYLSWKDHHSIHFHENEMFSFIKNIKNSWPNYIFNKKQKNNSFSKSLNVLKQQKYNEVVPSFWLLNSDIAFENEQHLREKKIFPVKVWTGMYLEKDSLFDEKEIKDFTIELVNNTSDLTNFLKIINTVIFRQNILTKDLFISKMNDDGFQFYVGKHNNEIVSTLLLFYNGDTTGIYFMANTEKHRNKGYASSLLKRALNDSINTSQTKFVLHATTDGYPVYKKWGFVKYNQLITFAGFQRKSTKHE